MDASEPPSPNGSGALLFRIGRDSDGNWVAQDQGGLRGGLFVTKAEALKFALFENGNQRQSIVMVPGGFELDMTRSVTARAHGIQTFRTLRAA